MVVCFLAAANGNADEDEVQQDLGWFWHVVWVLVDYCFSWYWFVYFL
jgi:hypothetical protein